MNENGNPLFRPLQAGDYVVVGKDEEYAGLSGVIKEVIPLGSPGHNTGNRTDDIVVDLSVTEYSDDVQSEITALMKNLGYDVDSYDDVSVDSVILAPENLIQVTGGELEQYYPELTASLERAIAVGELLADVHYTEIERAFQERVERNFTEYERDTLKFGSREVFDMAARIHAVSDAYSYLTSYCNLTEEELRFYMQFQNPLDVVAQKWYERNIDVDEMWFTIDYLWGRRESLMEEFALIVDEPTVPEQQRETAEPEIPHTAREQLYAKMSAEYETYIGELKTKPAGVILDSAYEKVFKEDLLVTIEDSGIDDDRLEALLSLEKPLDALYHNWLDTDVSYMDMLLDSVTEYADKIIEESEEITEPEPVKPQQTASKQPPSLLGEIRETAREIETQKAAHTAPTTTKMKEYEL